MPVVMKSFLLLFCLVSSMIGRSQFKIKTEVTSSGDTLYSTPDKKLYAAPGPKNAIGEIVKSRVYKSGTGFSLSLQIETGRTSVFTIGPDDAAELFLSDGSTVTLRPNGDNSSHRSAIDYGCWVFVFYRLNGEALRKLRSQDVQKITVSASLGKMTYAIRDKQADLIRKQVTSFDGDNK